MIVEDEALIALSLEDILQDEGYSVAGPFATCAGALASLERANPDLAILDAVLRDGPCLELARALRQRAVPFMIYSGQDEFEERPPELEGIIWVEKPSTLGAVLEAAQALLDRSRGSALPRND